MFYFNLNTRSQIFPLYESLLVSLKLMKRDRMALLWFLGPWSLLTLGCYNIRYLGFFAHPKVFCANRISSKFSRRDQNSKIRISNVIHEFVHVIIKTLGTWGLLDLL